MNMDVAIGRRCKHCGEPFEYHPGEEEWHYLYCSEACHVAEVGDQNDEPKAEETSENKERVREQLDELHKEPEGQGYEGDPAELYDAPDEASMDEEGMALGPEIPVGEDE